MTRSRAKSTHLGATGGDGWLEAAGGAGYLAKGVVYGVVGWCSHLVCYAVYCFFRARYRRFER